MAISNSKYLPLGLWLIFAVGATMSLFAMFQAGCTGDLKGGSLGDPGGALVLEGISLIAQYNF
jgi:hypothetical protein